MQQRIQQLIDRVDGMELRQRIMLLVAGLALLFFVADSFAIQPAIRQQKAISQAIADWELKLDVLSQRTGILPGYPGNSTDSRHSAMLAQVAMLNARLQERMGGLLAPAHAVKVLEQILKQERGLKLLEVNAGSGPLAGDGLLNEDGTPGSGVGRYQIQLQLEGSYLATLRYLRALENLPWRFFWESMDYQVTSYPTALITLDLYTLGFPGGSYQ